MTQTDEEIEVFKGEWPEDDDVVFIKNKDTKDFNAESRHKKEMSHNYHFFVTYHHFKYLFYNAIMSLSLVIVIVTSDKINIF